MNRILLIVFFIWGAFCSSSFSQEYQDWKYMHPSLQPNTMTKIQMIDANTWVTVGGNGTFMKTTDAGQNWFYHSHAGISGTGGNIGYLYGVHFFDANTGIVCGESGYIGTTTDGGATFTQVGIGLTTNRCQYMQFIDNYNGFIACMSGSGSAGAVLRTTNAGQTWTKIYTASGFGITSLTAFSSMKVIAAATDGSICITTNGGAYWDVTPAAVGQYNYAMAFVNSQIGFAAGSTFNKTTDGGLSWTTIAAPPNWDWSIHDIKVVSSSEVYFVGDPSYIWKTTDLGNTWTGILISVNGPSDTYIWEGIDRVGSNWVICGDFGVIGRSTDNGLTWSSTQRSFSTQLMFDITQVPGTKNMLAVGRQWTTQMRQVMRSSNGGTTWYPIDVPVGSNLQSISMIDSLVGFACGENSTIIKTTNGGLSWFQVSSPTTSSASLYKIKFVDNLNGWVFCNFVVPSEGNIFHTIDGGLTWTPQTTGTQDGITDASMVDNKTGYICMNPSGKPIYKTVDGGSTWAPVAIPWTSQTKAISAPDSNTIYIGTSYGTNRIAKSTNGGLSWTLIALPTTVDVNSLAFRNANIGYAAGNIYASICRTSDGGTTWSYQNVHLPTLVKVYVTPGDTAFALGTYCSILRNTVYASLPVELTALTASADNGNIVLSWSTASELNNKGFNIERAVMDTKSEFSWQNIGFVQGRGNSTEITSYSFTDNMLTAGTKYYYRLKQVDYNGSFIYSKVVEVGADFIPAKYTLSQNYPNPFNPSTRIQYSVPKDSKVKIDVYNVLGKLITTLVDEVKPAGQYEITFNASNLSSGVYLYKLSTGSEVLTNKMTLLK